MATRYQKSSEEAIRAFSVRNNLQNQVPEGMGWELSLNGRDITLDHKKGYDVFYIEGAGRMDIRDFSGVDMMTTLLDEIERMPQEY